MARVHNLLGTQKRTEYSPHQISRMTEKEVRSAYSDLRNIAVKRAARRGLDVDLPKVKELSPDEIRGKLAEASRFIRNPYSTKKGAEEMAAKISKSLARSGYTEAAKDPKRFGEFMERARQRAKGRMYDSGDTAEIFEAVEKLKMPAERLEKYFSSYLRSRSKLAQMAETLSGLADDPSMKNRKLTIRGLRDALRSR